MLEPVASLGGRGFPGVVVAGLTRWRRGRAHAVGGVELRRLSAARESHELPQPAAACMAFSPPVLTLLSFSLQPSAAQSCSRRTNTHLGGDPLKVYSYIVADDFGFAPNPFHGFCTLACCKPDIRKGARVGDLVIGMTTLGGRFVFAMKVAHVITFTQYWESPQYAAKRPDMCSTRAIDRYGDNIYEPTAPGEFRQIPSHHCKPDGTESKENKDRDLDGVHVLVAEHFAYFGQNGPPVPPELAFLRVGRKHRSHFTPEKVQEVEQWFRTLPQGVHGRPALWPDNDTSWQQP